MSTINHTSIAARLTTGRLTSYLAASGGDIPLAIALYDWNAEISGALHEDIGRFEVVFRNALDRALEDHGARQGWPTIWYRRRELFAGKHGERMLAAIAAARRRAEGRPAMRSMERLSPS